MKKCLILSVIIAFSIALIPVYIHSEIDQRDFDGDGDIDGDDLSVFAEKFGSVIWYKDFDGDGYSDGNTEYSVFQPTDYYPESEITATDGDCEDGDENVNPGMNEICDDGIDNDCDGQVDNGCAQCTSGQSEPCYTGDPVTQDVGECRSGTKTCINGAWGACVGEVLPEAEICDELDNNCDGEIDEGLSCNGDPCDDGDLCTVNDTIWDNVCIGEPKVCDDGVNCTMNSCDPATGDCLFSPNDSLCDGGDPCYYYVCNSDTGCYAVHSPIDEDHDGDYSLECGGMDCDDNNGNIFTGQTLCFEIPDDYNCDGEIMEISTNCYL